MIVAIGGDSRFNYKMQKYVFRVALKSNYLSLERFGIKDGMKIKQTKLIN